MRALTASPKRPPPRIAAILLCALCLPHLHRAAVTNLPPVADTFLSESWPDHNFGGMTFMNAGTTQNYTTNRALLKFDPASALPAGARITSATLLIEVVSVPAEEPLPFSNFRLHRVLRDWGEGDKTTPAGSTESGKGAPAGTNEANFTHRFAYTGESWGRPGGEPGVDYVSSFSAQKFVEGIDQYVYAPPNGLDEDVQFWLDHPESNFGWMMLVQQETTSFTARRIGTREDPVNTPILTIEYDVPPRIKQAGVTANQFRLSFEAEAGQSYAVEFTGNLSSSNAWTLLTNIPAQFPGTNFIVTDPLTTSQRMYRVGSP